MLVACLTLALVHACAAFSASPSLLVQPPRRPSARLCKHIASESLAVTTSKAALGLAAQPVALSSLYSLITTGCGLKGDNQSTLEGIAYIVVAGFAASSLFTRATKNCDLLQAELAAAEEERAVLEGIGEEDPLRMARLENMEQKLNDLANGPTAQLLTAAELSSLVTAAAAILVFGFVLVSNGSLPSALPVADGLCWS